MKTEKVDSKELAVVRGQITKALSAAQTLTIKNDADLGEANNLRAKIKKVGEFITERKERFTRPAYQAYKQIMEEAKELFGPVEAQYKVAEKMVKDKMVEYHLAKEAEARKKEEQIAKKVENGTMKFETGIKKIEEVKKPETKIESEKGTAIFRIHREVVIEDETKIPREYLTPDLVRIRKDALDGKQISGVKVVETKILAGSRAN